MTLTTAPDIVVRARLPTRSIVVECSRDSLRLPRGRSGTSIALIEREGDMRYTRISADCHIDMPWLPPDLFTANASALMKDRMPYVVEGPDGPQWTTKKGAPFGLVGGIGSAGTKDVPRPQHPVDGVAFTGPHVHGQKRSRPPGRTHL